MLELWRDILWPPPEQNISPDRLSELWRRKAWRCLRRIGVIYVMKRPLLDRWSRQGVREESKECKARNDGGGIERRVSEPGPCRFLLTCLVPATDGASPGAGLRSLASKTCSIKMR